MEKLFAKIKKETLKPDEKAKVFSVLEKFVAENPVQSVRSPFYRTLVFMRQKNFIIPTIAIIIIILSGSTALAAKNSLPGQTLYSVKMIGESAQSFLALNPKSKAQIEASHAISRLQEIEQVASLNKQLNEGEGKDMSGNFENQVKSVTKNIDKLKDKGQSEDASIIWSDFKKSVAVHEKTIEDLSNSSTTKTETKKELDNIVSSINSQFNEDNKDSEQNNIEIQNSTSSIPETKTEIKQNTETHQDSNREDSHSSEQRDNNN